MSDTGAEFDIAQTDRLLMTTKAVSKRLDLTRPVPMSVVLDCIKVASHAPIGGNREVNRWLVITDPAQKAALAEIYAEVGRPYAESGREIAQADARFDTILDATMHLIDHLAEVPVLVMPLRIGHVHEGQLGKDSRSYFGSVIPGVWSFQLAARSRGLGTRYTTFTGQREREVAELLKLPDHVNQIALLPLAYYTGTTFTPAPRLPAEDVTYLDTWGTPVPPASSS